LLEYLEDVQPGIQADVPARLPVQMVVRPRTAEHPDYRGYAGRIEAGQLRVGDAVIALPSGRRTSVVGIDTADRSLPVAEAGRSVVVRLADEIDIARGDMIAVDAEPRPHVVSRFAATLCWLSDRPLRPGDRFALKHTTREVRAVVDDVQSRLDVATVTSNRAAELELNDIGTVYLRTADPVIVDAYAVNRSTGAFLLVDENSGATMAAGMVSAVQA
jgi:sulfate adenylyltransferase subunit 1